MLLFFLAFFICGSSKISSFSDYSSSSNSGSFSLSFSSSNATFLYFLVLYFVLSKMLFADLKN